MSSKPQAVLAYLSRYTHRVAISNRRLISADEAGVTLTWKDYRIEGPDRYKTMTLPTHEFIRPRLNPHRAGGSPRDFVLHAFPTPAARACSQPRHCRRPKTCT